MIIVSRCLLSSLSIFLDALSNQVWNYIGQCMCTLFGHQGAVTCLQFDSRRIVSGSLDCNIKFWDMVTGECINTIDWKAAEGHTGVVRSADCLFSCFHLVGCLCFYLCATMFSGPLIKSCVNI